MLYYFMVRNSMMHAVGTEIINNNSRKKKASQTVLELTVSADINRIIKIIIKEGKKHVRKSRTSMPTKLP